ncbi:hypothetical protein K438DRAFT_1767352 [Mycena galopus ATCC 62051]|nr:hypothetical protein K438DRAFT_1767352 [Mycena galopus ATCC 62051]
MSTSSSSSSVRRFFAGRPLPLPDFALLGGFVIKGSLRALSSMPLPRVVHLLVEDLAVQRAALEDVFEARELRELRRGQLAFDSCFLVSFSFGGVGSLVDCCIVHVSSATTETPHRNGLASSSS